MAIRGGIYFAMVGDVMNPGTKHFAVYPDEYGNTVEELMPPARMLVLNQEPGDEWGLYRYDAKGEFAGDTAHESYDDAIHQVTFEYGSAVGEWRESYVENIEQFVYQELGINRPTGGAA